jgi:hypothetical protein
VGFIVRVSAETRSTHDQSRELAVKGYRYPQVIACIGVSS